MRKRLGLSIALIGALSMAFGSFSLFLQREAEPLHEPGFSGTATPDPLPPAAPDRWDDEDLTILRARPAISAVLLGVVLTAVGGYLWQKRLWLYGDPKGKGASWR